MNPTISALLEARDARHDAGVGRCDLCGRRVTDPDAHLVACLDHELTMFTIGRRAS